MRDLEKIKAIPICEYLASKGVKVPAHGNISAFWRGDRNPSVSLDRAGNRWYDHGTGEHGSVIDLCMRFEGCSFEQALDILASGSSSFTELPAIAPCKKEPAIIFDSIGYIQHPALLQYLRSRCISPSLANIFCKEVFFHYANDPQQRLKFAIGFQNQRGGWELRCSCFKKCTGKFYSHIDNGGSHIVVFEGFFDYLSYLEFPDSIIPKRAAENHLILNSIAMADCMLRDLKAGKLGNISTASLYLDADDAGRKTSAKIEREFEAMGIRLLEDGWARLAEYWPGAEDVNDALKSYQQQVHNNQNLTTQ